MIFDGGARRGRHVFKAPSAGTDIVADGRPVRFGSAGAAALKRCLIFFAGEPKMAMTSAGTGNIETVRKPSLLFRR
ncbi:MAG: hypothetical protein BHW58_04670 [Azospirillum sp. 51_20]|nr:MAG: hypothetical protein BHW58_04670 [Azospirillum sp. 51_20]